MGDNGRATPDTVPSSPPFANANNYLPSDALLSSPVRSSRRKERRLPSVTPRRLGRFFTPRSSLPSAQSLPGRRILGNLDEAAVNRQWQSDIDLSSDPIVSSPTDRSFGNGPNTRKRRAEQRTDTAIKRRSILPDDSPLPRLNLGSSANRAGRDVTMADADAEGETEEQLADKRRATLSHFFKTSRGHQTRSKSDLSLIMTAEASPDSEPLVDYRPQPIRKLRNRGRGAQMLDREHGLSSLSGRHALARPVADPRGPVAGFHSDSSDLHHCNNYDSTGSTVVFSQASAHTAPVTAVGDEQGYVRFFNTSSTAANKVDMHFKVHDNAVMDLAFSDDDLRLATACGDKTGKVVDVATQMTAVELEGGHEDSMRQIAFQPGQGNGDVLATSDKAGRIRIWDLRCPSVPTGSFAHRTAAGEIVQRTAVGQGSAQSTNCIRQAHSRTVHGVTSVASIPAIQWFPGGRSHLLLSASEANAAIKLWDTRYIKPRRHAEDVALATTAQPKSHAWRSYGITSMTLSSDAARLYAVCRDSIVYAYSTAHLILGTAPDLAMPAGGPKHRPTGQTGLGPLYGLRHEALRVNSFYVKSAIRQTDDPSREILAVGSSESSPVLFPTDERYMHSSFAAASHLPASTSAPRTPHSRALSSAANSPSPLLPIYSTGGTALIRGHSREVTTMSWSSEGRLVTASDDYIVRHWQDDAERARYLRQVGEFGGERFMCGWADVGEQWDLDDDES